MRKKELKIMEIPKWGKYLRGKWRQSFAGHYKPRAKIDLAGCFSLALM